MRTICVIGLGNMGRGMALSLRRAGFKVSGVDPSAAPRERLRDDGIAVHERLHDAGEEIDAIVLSLPSAAVVREVALGAEGIIGNARAGLVVIDTSTSHPETTLEVAHALGKAGIAFVDAPVSGGAKGAIGGSLTMVLGGSVEDIARIEPVLAAMSAKRVHVGPLGAGHFAKIANNLLCATHLLISGEMLRMAKAAGLPMDSVLKAVNGGSGRSFVTEHNLPTWVLSGSFDSGFTMKLMRKDVALAGELIRGLALELPLAQRVAELWAASATALLDDDDFNRIAQPEPARQD